ncbi:LysR family transcriptional regulator [Vibrio barjaei]|jgi:DNA-binding transcriptional LysR family regulator|uniref:LysR family transcriptional regulator n=1 Tax=Vibrio barjaei TaxID=1676683 RepID=A0ABW7IQ56_9VIBR|nr:LysR family transcriptional regulator [Vibrio barjaei]MCY9869971.1 LysR family transcriptional regulator [Vibrio barjaei]
MAVEKIKLDFNALEVFKVVVDMKSFSKAADTLDVNTSTISRKINELEQHYQSKLITRTTRTQTLTPEGEILYQYCSDLLKLMQESKDHLLETSGSTKGSIHIVINHFSYETLFKDGFTAFAQSHPDLDIRVEISNEQVNMIKDNVDVWIKPGEVSLDHAIVKKFSLGKRRLLASPEYIRVNKLLNGNEVLEGHRPDIKRIYIHTPLSEKFNVELSHLDYAYSVNSARCALTAVKLGLGVIVAPEKMVKEEIASGELRFVDSTSIDNEYYLSVCYRERKPRPARIDTILSYIYRTLEARL